MRDEHATRGSTDLFYQELRPFLDFAEFTDFDAFEPVPDDWVVMIADVKGSTQAIELGQYKKVNMVGAASITAVLNACRGIEVPYVFGGDGGTLVVPGSLRKPSSRALLRLKGMSEQAFGLSLRTGAIPVADLRAKGTDVRARKLELSSGNALAIFAGGGIEMADRLLKEAGPDNPYLLEAPSDTAPPDLRGLSCRWEPLKPTGGRMITIMVRGTGEGPDGESDLLLDVVRKISELLDHDLGESAPASVRSMTFRWPPRGLVLEARATAGRQPFLWRYLVTLISSLVQSWCERFDRRAGPYNAPVYRGELRSNTDFRKYDGILRLVLDVTEAQAESIKRYLERKYQAGNLVYGLHVSDAALMTCLVFSLEQSRHVHFIDGSDGGFAMAAREFKSRLDVPA